MTPESDFQPLVNALKDKFNIFLVVLGLAAVIDFFTGHRLASQIVFLQMKLAHVNPHKPGYTITTLFGNYHEVKTLARVFDQAGIVIFLIFPLWSYFKGILGTMHNFKMKSEK